MGSTSIFWNAWFSSGLEYLVLFRSSSTSFLVSCFHFSDVKEHINWLIFKRQRNLKARENAFKNNLLAVPAD